MKGCSRIRGQLSVYIDGQLAAHEKKKIEDHLLSCAQCRGALDELKKTVSHLQGLDQVETPPWFTQQVMTKIHAEAARRKKGFLERFFRPLPLKLPLGAVATLVLALTTYFLFQGIFPQMQAEQALQRPEVPVQLAPAVPAPEPERAVVTPKPTDIKEPVVEKKTAEPLKQNSVLSQKPVTPELASTPPPAPEPKAAPAPQPAAPIPAAAPAQVERKAVNVQEQAAADSVTTAGAKKELADKRDASGGLAGEPAKSGEVRSGPPPAKQKMAEKVPVSFHVSAPDPAAAVKQVVETLNRLQGTNIKTSAGGMKIFVRAELSPLKLPELFARLRTVGSVQETRIPALRDVNNVSLTIEISQASSLPRPSTP